MPSLKNTLQVLDKNQSKLHKVMRNKKEFMMSRYFLALVAFLLCIRPLSAELTTEVPVKIPFETDGRKWEVVRNEEVKGQGLVEYIPEGQTPENWQDVVTLQYFSSNKVTPQQLFQLFINDIQAQAGEGEFKKEIIQEAPTNVIAQWSISGTKHDQTELIRIASKGDLIAIIRYSYHSSNPPTDVISKWKSILEKVQL